MTFRQLQSRKGRANQTPLNCRFVACLCTVVHLSPQAQPHKPSLLFELFFVAVVSRLCPAVYMRPGSRFTPIAEVTPSASDEPSRLATTGVPFLSLAITGSTFRSSSITSVTINHSSHKLVTQAVSDAVRARTNERTNLSHDRVSHTHFAWPCCCCAGEGCCCSAEVSSDQGHLPRAAHHTHHERTPYTP